MLSATSFTNSGLDDDEARILAHIINTIEAKSIRNLTRDAYYQGTERVRQLGIAIPPSLSGINTVVGWPTMAVDALEERLDIEGFVFSGNSSGSDELAEIFAANNGPVESSMAHVDAMIYGLEFIAVSDGDPRVPDEPHPLITIEPPTRMSAIWDGRARRNEAAGSVRWDPENHGPIAATLYLPTETVFLDAVGSRWEVIDRQEHRLGFVPVVRMPNKPRSGRPWGTSEISRAVMSLTDQAVRTLLGMEVAREFYSSPQRYILGASEDAFVGSDGLPRAAWEVYLGRFLAVTAGENGQNPEVGQFAASSPAPYIDQIKGLAQLASAEMALPASYLGFHTENPASADAIRAAEARLVKRAERRQSVFGAAWAQVMRLALLVRDGTLPADANRLTTLWRDASTPTKAASADATMKLVSSGILPPTSEVTYEQLGFDATTRSRLLAEARRARADAALNAFLNDDVPDAAPA